MAEENKNINPEEELSKQDKENKEESLQEQEGSQEESPEEKVKENKEDLSNQLVETLLQHETENPSEGENKNIESIDNEKLEMLLDIPLEISVEIGSRTLHLEDILKLNPNTVLELDKYINEPVDIKINGKLIAKGELYTVENNFGIKITNIVTVQERLKFLMENGGE